MSNTPTAVPSNAVPFILHDSRAHRDIPVHIVREFAYSDPDAEGWVVGDTNALVTGLIRLKDEVAAGLMDQLVSVVFAEVLGENPAGEVAGKFQLPDITSSRTRWRRILLFAFSG